jgi:hypothetical protein
LFVGKESGWFEKAVFDAETIFFANPGDDNAALAGGFIDFSTNPFTLPFFAASSGVPIRVISGAGGWDDADVGAFGGQRPTIARPIPFALPVTSATLPPSSPTILNLSCCVS